MQMWSFLIRFELWNIQTFVARLHATIFYAIATLKMQLKPSKQFGKCSNNLGSSPQYSVNKN